MTADVELTCWQAVKAREPMAIARRTVSPAALAPHDVLVRVAGCGVCHTDLGFLYDGVRTGKPFPLTLGHEIAGRVVAAGSDNTHLVGRAVVVPAVIPCGECRLCLKGRGSICRAQLFPGSDIDGGFASHVVVPARGLCPVDEAQLASAGLDLSELSVLADAISTPYQAIVRAGVTQGDVAIFVGAGGVGGFGIQIAAAQGARVVALDTSQERLDIMSRHGASLALRPDKLDFKGVRSAVRAFADAEKVPSWRWKIFECSGTAAGQSTAFGLLGHGGFLSVVGFTPDKVEVRLSNLMAFDATVQGNWGCLPEHYPAVLGLVLSGKVALAPFIERRPLASINETFTALHERRLSRRVILTPEA